MNQIGYTVCSLITSFCQGFAAAAAKSLQSCPTLCDPIDGSPPGSSVPGILQARILEWVTISFSNAYMPAKLLRLCPTLCDLWTAALQAPLSTGFSKQEYWRGLPFPSPVKVLGEAYFPGGSDCKVSAYNAGDLGSIPESGRSPGEGNGNPLQYSCLPGKSHG